MSASVQIEFISSGFREILMSSEVDSLNVEAADKIAANAEAASDGGEFSVKSWRGGYGGGRMVASVSTDNYEAALAEAECNALSGAVHG